MRFRWRRAAFLLPACAWIAAAPVHAEPILGDADHDTDRDLADFAGLANCLSISGPSLECSLFGFSPDADINALDYRSFLCGFGGQRLLTAIRDRKADAVVMLKLDRMFRNAGDCLTTVERWGKAGVALHVADLRGNAIEPTSAAGRFMLVVLATLRKRNAI